MGVSKRTPNTRTQHWLRNFKCAWVKQPGLLFRYGAGLHVTSPLPQPSRLRQSVSRRSLVVAKPELAWPMLQRPYQQRWRGPVRASLRCIQQEEKVIILPSLQKMWKLKRRWEDVSLLKCGWLMKALGCEMFSAYTGASMLTDLGRGYVLLRLMLADAWGYSGEANRTGRSN